MAASVRSPLRVIVVLACFILANCTEPGAKKRPATTLQSSLDSLWMASKGHDSLVIGTHFISNKKDYALELFRSKDSSFYSLFRLDTSFSQKRWIRARASQPLPINRMMNHDTLRLNDSLLLYMDGNIILPNVGHTPQRTKGPVNQAFLYLNPLSGTLIKGIFRPPVQGMAQTIRIQFDRGQKIPDSLKTELKKFALGKALNASTQSGDLTPGLPAAKNTAFYVKRWVMLNDRVYDELTGVGPGFQLNIEEFPGDISPGPVELSGRDSAYKKSVKMMQNSQFRILSLPNGPVFCINKSTHRSFLIWVPANDSSFVRDIQIKGNRVLFYDSLRTGAAKKNHPSLEYNLSLRTIKKLR